jgi:indole-3-glycerol phosphate synthase
MPPGGTLGRLIDEARARAAALAVGSTHAELQERAREAAPGPSLAAALRGGSVAIIAEVKRRSPSKGPINPGLSAADQARRYATGGARAISVLTEPVHFGGASDDLCTVRAAVPLPVLRKDFHVEPVQLLEARSLGASAILLIARALAPARLGEMVRSAHALGLEVLLEVRDEAELERALETDAAIIGVNNRNLETLEIDARTMARLVPMIPAERVAVAESGMTSPADVAAAASYGADAVLVGSYLSAAADPAAALAALTDIPSRIRAA